LISDIFSYPLKKGAGKARAPSPREVG